MSGALGDQQSMNSQLWSQDIQRGYNQQLLAAQMGPGIVFHNNHFENCVTSGGRYRSGRGLSRRAFMQRTRSGLRARKVAEVLFWIGLSAFVGLGIVLPITLKLGTLLWMWALT